jgi:PAS domain-containing protein
MNSEIAQILMKRADAARRRLAGLEEQITRKAGASGTLPNPVQSVLRELDLVLSELHVATEQLEAATRDLTQARQEVLVYEERYREFHEAVPAACILTCDEGNIEEANSRAAHMLNVGRRHLPGKPVLLFLPERERFFSLMDTVRETGTADGAFNLRPRDLKPRPVKIAINRIGMKVAEERTRLCWLISEVSG